MNYPICVGITGASGAVYAVRLLEVLCASGREVHLSISPAGRDIIRQELGREIDLDDFQPVSLLSASCAAARVHYHHWQDYHSPLASGSARTGGMVICPCSGGTLSAVAAGAAGNLIQRAAEVHLKERRKLVLVPRETPLSLTHIENMRKVTLAGAIVLPASPGWYHGVKSADDLVDFIVARICDQLGVENSLTPRWGVE
jgi:4-hydroxy-3-polyprenylbenzoate decarboxylase